MVGNEGQVTLYLLWHFQQYINPGIPNDWPLMVTKTYLIVVSPRPAILAPKNLTIPPPRQNLIAPQPPSPRVPPPPPPLSRQRVVTPPAPRVEIPTQLSRLARKAPRVENIIDEESEIVEKEHCVAPAYNTISKEKTSGQSPRR